MKLVADGAFASVLEVTAEKLRGKGIKLVLADLDNTLAPYNAEAPTPEVLRWHEGLRAAGITLYVVSNNRKESGRRYLETLGAPYVQDAHKPRAAALLRAMEETGAGRDETVLLGDQTFTDVLAAGNAGIPALLIRPVKLEDVLRTLRYYAEAPFRLPLKRKDFFGHEQNK